MAAASMQSIALSIQENPVPQRSPKLQAALDEIEAMLEQSPAVAPTTFGGCGGPGGRSLHLRILQFRNATPRK